ncbi:hypothetical protein PR048_017122 [Dryococelus australis]|uniref:Uncharacterized protein n=1 Tax=Dryococelus australis TaxID=614101 RepID=A0ABQ9H8M4_9NEOP|nr:hypothetical protein PR048_017122 [Dryococelus australis]
MTYFANMRCVFGMCEGRHTRDESVTYLLRGTRARPVYRVDRVVFRQGRKSGTVSSALHFGGITLIRGHARACAVTRIAGGQVRDSVGCRWGRFGDRDPPKPWIRYSVGPVSTTRVGFHYWAVPALFTLLRIPERQEKGMRKEVATIEPAEVGQNQFPNPGKYSFRHQKRGGKNKHQADKLTLRGALSSAGALPFSTPGWKKGWPSNYVEYVQKCRSSQTRRSTPSGTRSAVKIANPRLAHYIQSMRAYRSSLIFDSKIAVKTRRANGSFGTRQCGEGTGQTGPQWLVRLDVWRSSARLGRARQSLARLKGLLGSPRLRLAEFIRRCSTVPPEAVHSMFMRRIPGPISSRIPESTGELLYNRDHSAADRRRSSTPVHPRAATMCFARFHQVGYEINSRQENDTSEINAQLEQTSGEFRKDAVTHTHTELNADSEKFKQRFPTVKHNTADLEERIAIQFESLGHQIGDRLDEEKITAEPKFNKFSGEVKLVSEKLNEVIRSVGELRINHPDHSPTYPTTNANPEEVSCSLNRSRRREAEKKHRHEKVEVDEDENNKEERKKDEERRKERRKGEKEGTRSKYRGILEALVNSRHKTSNHGILEAPTDLRYKILSDEILAILTDRRSFFFDMSKLQTPPETRTKLEDEDNEERRQELLEFARRRLILAAEQRSKYAIRLQKKDLAVGQLVLMATADYSIGSEERTVRTKIRNRTQCNAPIRDTLCKDISRGGKRNATPIASSLKWNSHPDVAQEHKIKIFMNEQRAAMCCFDQLIKKLCMDGRAGAEWSFSACPIEGRRNVKKRFLTAGSPISSRIPESTGELLYNRDHSAADRRRSSTPAHPRAATMCFASPHARVKRTEDRGGVARARTRDPPTTESANLPLSHRATIDSNQAKKMYTPTRLLIPSTMPTNTSPGAGQPSASRACGYTLKDARAVWEEVLGQQYSNRNSQLAHSKSRELRDAKLAVQQFERRSSCGRSSSIYTPYEVEENDHDRELTTTTLFQYNSPSGTTWAVYFHHKCNTIPLCTELRPTIMEYVTNSPHTFRYLQRSIAGASAKASHWIAWYAEIERTVRLSEAVLSCKPRRIFAATCPVPNDLAVDERLAPTYSSTSERSCNTGESTQRFSNITLVCHGMTPIKDKTPATQHNRRTIQQGMLPTNQAHDVKVKCQIVQQYRHGHIYKAYGSVLMITMKAFDRLPIKLLYSEATRVPKSLAVSTSIINLWFKAINGDDGDVGVSKEWPGSQQSRGNGDLATPVVDKIHTHALPGIRAQSLSHTKSVALQPTVPRQLQDVIMNYVKISLTSGWWCFHNINRTICIMEEICARPGNDKVARAVHRRIESTDEK